MAVISAVKLQILSGISYIRHSARKKLRNDWQKQSQEVHRFGGIWCFLRLFCFIVKRQLRAYYLISSIFPYFLL